ncbi:hypothetical protein K474DRAFT_1557508, partial [Panus rudis PR-1116 ss-1]
MKPQTKIFENPEFDAAEVDLSLFSTICLVFTMVLAAGLFIFFMSCLLLWDEC